LIPTPLNAFMINVPDLIVEKGVVVNVLFQTKL
jgi:hypothetical protein